MSPGQMVLSSLTQYRTSHEWLMDYETGCGLRIYSYENVIDMKLIVGKRLYENEICNELRNPRKIMRSHEIEMTVQLNVMN